MKHKQIIIGLFSCVLLVGCATPRPVPQIPIELQYQQPEKSPDSATIIGSQENSSWADNLTAYISDVDGKRPLGGRKVWNVPLRLTSGKHSISVAFIRGSYSAKADIQFEAKAGMAYQVKYATDVGHDSKNTYCDFWIADISSGTAVTEILHRPISCNGCAGNDPIIIYIPARR